ncbi:MAG: threonine--tRNA ligase [Phycisphaerales bacterium]|jgi:threonyl-tRNA synthetase|nr:threonine--tRNA ligase [Phycisphaerales bacterium]
MPRITLPDGSVRTHDGPVSALSVAADISPNLADAALGARVNGLLCDIGTMIDDDATVELVTTRPGEKESSADALHLIRHSAAHVMAEAIMRLHPDALLVYGPPLDTGFYYDIAFPDGHELSSDDFEKIEKEMAAIIEEDRPFTRFDMPADAGLEKLRSEGSKYKIDNAERAIAEGSTSLSWYATGEPGSDWEDLCRGPHVPSTGRIGAAKVLSLASSYWHGDANSDRLTRVYGTAFANRKQLKRHLKQLEEAKTRDHRLIGRELDLFHIDEQVGQGLPLWMPAGAIVRQELQNFISHELRRQGYEQVFTPHIGKLDLYRTSGHYPYYSESQYPPLIDRDCLQHLADEGCSCGDLANRMEDGDIDGYLLKPMNCPHHIRIYACRPHSYRDLPLRLAEFGTVYRREQSGELGGLTRVRGFTQDDAHIFCTEEQVASEIAGCLELVKVIFETLGMTDYKVRIGLRDPDGSKYVGDAANWDKAEAACRAAARSLGAPFSEDAGEAAFYGPKIDFIVKDVLGRSWQLGTVQVDYNLPERFELEYVGADGKTHRPVMIHRAPFGSMERFVGVLIEHFGGAFPTWLAPEQVRVLPISEKSNAWGETVLAALHDHGIRATLDDQNDRIQAKIREGAERKVPYLAVVGPRDAEAGSVSIRMRGIREDLGAVNLEQFVDSVSQEITTRGEASALQACFPDYQGIS